MIPLIRRSSIEGLVSRTILRKFGSLAAASLGVLLVSGLFMSGQQVATLDAALVTLYGQALISKVALAVCVVLIGLANSSMLHRGVARLVGMFFRPWQDRPPEYLRNLRVLVPLEAFGALGVLFFASVLTSVQPALGPEFEPASTSAGSSLPSSISTQVDDLLLSVGIKPNRPGQNFIDVSVFDTRRPAPAPIEQLVLQLEPPGKPDQPKAILLDSQGAGQFRTASNDLDLPGDWTIKLTVRRDGLADVVWTTAWYVLPGLPSPRAMILSNRPLAPVLTLASAICAVGLAALFIGVRMRRTRRASQYRPGSTIQTLYLFLRKG